MTTPFIVTGSSGTALPMKLSKLESGLKLGENYIPWTIHNSSELALKTVAWVSGRTYRLTIWQRQSAIKEGKIQAFAPVTWHKNNVQYTGTAFMKSNWKIGERVPFYAAVEALGWNFGMVERFGLDDGRNKDVVAELNFDQAKIMTAADLALESQLEDKKPPINYWIFQGNPDQFELTDYVHDHDFINWTVRQKSFINEMNVGDEVYIWQSAGNASAISGVIASANVIAAPKELPEDPIALKYWRNPASLKSEPRVRLRIKRRCLGSKEIVRREWIKNDPILKGLLILRLAQNTNYKISELEAQRLAALTKLGEPTIPTAEAEKLGRKAPIPTLPKYKDFGEAPNDDPTDLQMFARKVRKGQAQFRKNLIELYGGRCAISGWAPEAVLEAAHISEHAKSGINHTDNGILLRSDLHLLLDANLFSIDPDTSNVSLDESLSKTPYWQYHGIPLPTRTNGSQIGRKYLRERFGDTAS